MKARFTRYPSAYGGVFGFSGLGKTGELVGGTLLPGWLIAVGPGCAGIADSGVRLLSVWDRSQPATSANAPHPTNADSTIRFIVFVFIFFFVYYSTISVCTDLALPMPPQLNPSLLVDGRSFKKLDAEPGPGNK